MSDEPTNTEVRPFRIAVPQADLDDLRGRLGRTRWTDEVDHAGWDYGTNLDYLRELTNYWLEGFDWRRQEDELNRFAQFRAEIDGFGVHFVHERGKGPDPMPLLLLHGWPDSFYRFHKIVPMLTDPERHGGDPADSFDVVVPSLPGFGFSDRPRERGWGQERDAALFHRLMTGAPRLRPIRRARRRWWKPGLPVARALSPWVRRRHPPHRHRLRQGRATGPFELLRSRTTVHERPGAKVLRGGRVRHDPG